MKIIHVSRPKSQIVTIHKRHPVSNVPVKQEKKQLSYIDESFMNQPIDLRKIKVDQLPITPEIEDDSSLNVPLTIVGRRSQTNTANDRKEIEDLKLILRSVQREQRLNQPPKKEYHLSKHLQPPVIERFCPEKYLTDKTIHNISKDRDIEQKLNREYVRPFPFDLISSSVNGFDVDIKKRVAQKAKPTFTEIEEHEVRDFFF